MSSLYVPGDHERALGRDVVLAPPTCCCCCCCCTLVAPEVITGRRFARETEEALAKTETPRAFWDEQLPFAAGVLLANILASPLALLVGIVPIAYTAGLYAAVVLAGLAYAIILHTTRLGAKVDNAMGGALWGFALCGIVALQIAAELAVILAVAMGNDADPRTLLVVAGAAAPVIPIIVLGMRARRAARHAAAEVKPLAPPPL